MNNQPEMNEIQSAIENLKKAMAATDAQLSKMRARAAKIATPERVAATIQATRTTVKVGAIVTTLGFLLTVYATVQAALIISNIVRMSYGAYMAIKIDYRASHPQEPPFSELRGLALDEVTAELVEITPALLGGLTRGLGGLSQDIGNLTDQAIQAVLAKMDEEAPFEPQENPEGQHSVIDYETVQFSYGPSPANPTTEDLDDLWDGDYVEAAEDPENQGMTQAPDYQGDRAIEQTGRGRK